MPKSKKEIQIISGLLAILLIIVLLIPAFTAFGLQQAKTYTVVTTAESNYNLVKWAESEQLNRSLHGLMIHGAFPLDISESNNDTVVYHSQQHYGFTNDVNVVADINYVITNLTELIPFTTDGIWHQVDLTTHELAQHDFITIQSNAKHLNWGFTYWDGIGTGKVIEHTHINMPQPNTTAFIIDLGAEQDLLSVPDTSISILFETLDITDESYWFKVGIYDLSDTVWAWDDTQLYSVSIGFSIVILAVAIAFNTDVLDIRIDRKRKDQN